MGALGRLICFLGIVAILTGCSTASPEAEGPRSMKSPVFLTRDGCVNTVQMRSNVEEALRTLGLPNDYQLIDADTLKASDPRGGYGTPTVLYGNSDLFGMPEPGVPHPPPT